MDMQAQMKADMAETKLNGLKCLFCGNQLQGRQKTYCSDRCRKQAERQKKASEDGPGSSNSDTTIPQMPPKSDKTSDLDETRTASFEDYYAHPEDYAHRTNPEAMDWDKRSPIPGDWDYDGACEKIGEVWKGKEPEHSDIDIIEQPTSGKGQYTQPTGQRDERTRDMKPADLLRRIRGSGVTWHQTPEYAEQIFRLQTLTIEQLEKAGQEIPMWRKALEK